MIRSYKYRAYPTEAQRASIDHALGTNRFLYNCALEERITYYKRENKGLSFAKQSAQLPAIKKEFPGMFANVYSQTSQQTLMRLDVSFKAFFKGKGFPRFKSAKRFKSITFPQSNLMGAAGAKCLQNGNFDIFGIGELKTIMHRPFEGRCLQVMLKKEDNLYFVIMICELQQPTVVPAKDPKVNAIDLGIKTFIVMDDGTSFHHPKPWKTSKEKLTYQQRKLALKKRGSVSRKKALSALQKTSRHIANIRDDWQHKTANHLIKKSDILFVEKLASQEMIIKASKNKAAFGQPKPENISEAAWGSFAQKLVYKAESAGKQVVFVNPKNTSKCCSNCQEINKELTLKDRIYSCHYCGAIMDRDNNAAINIKWIGTIQAGILFGGLPNKNLPENFSLNGYRS